MFYTNQSLHHPDSPRHMDAGCWANEHTVALRNQFDPRHVAVNGFDVTPYIDQIEQGVVALFPVTRNESLRGFRFIYKLPKGKLAVYTNIENLVNFHIFLCFM